VDSGDPPAPAQLREHLVTLRTRVDAHFAAALERSPAAMACRAGCDACCRVRFGVFEIEAEPIRAALARIGREDPARRERIRRQVDTAHCALLVDGRCSVYAERPLICRSQGLPLAVDGRLDWCPLNFTRAPPPPESTLRLDALNRPLAAVAQAFSGGRRVALADLARAPDPV
jgi:hypothetical protein